MTIALLWIRVASRSRLKISLFEILCGRPFHVSAQEGECINTLKDLAVANCVKTLGTIQTSVYELASRKPSLHPFWPGHCILSKHVENKGLGTS